ncbi:hypothetical protein BH23CHL7_BH23CHL7_17150 [soil metagenome]
MALNIDTTRAARSPIARRQLVDAVLAAPSHEQELDWIEWKSPPDIQTHRGAIARQILAFANREVSRALRTVEGCGYLLVGAAPGGNLVGVTPVDSADLSNWLDPFVGGADGPQWDPDYVDVNGTHVLLITVAPPRDGDRPWPLRREWNPGQRGTVLQEGTIFTRRTGQTVQANAAEQDMLWARARATARRLTVDVRRSDATLGRTFNASSDAIGEWIEEERSRLLAPLSKPEPATAPAGGAGVPAFNETISKLAAELATGGFLGGLPEDRTQDQYRTEVDNYLAKAANRLPRHARWKAATMRLAVLRLHVVNLTEFPYAQLEVQVHIPGAVRAYWSPWDARPKEDFPSPPRLWGPRSNAFARLGFGMYSPSYLSSAILNPAAQSMRGWIKNSGSATVTFLPFDLRPTETWGLDEMILAADHSLAGQAVRASWEATSTNAQGRNAGDFEVTFDSDVVELTELLAANDDADADADEDD